MRLTPQIIERFWSKVEKTDGCWNWRAGKNQGYGQFHISKGKSSVRAHRVAWEILRGEIPDGLVLDHLCRNHSCVNPDHLEPVTHKENVLRGVGATARLAGQTHCKNGHPLEGENLRKAWYRQCRICFLKKRSEYRNTDKYRIARSAARRKSDPKTGPYKHGQSPAQGYYVLNEYNQAKGGA